MSTYLYIYIFFVFFKSNTNNINEHEFYARGSGLYGRTFASTPDVHINVDCMAYKCLGLQNLARSV